MHYSTDYVFDGAKRRPYVETDATDPLSVYGAHQARGRARGRGERLPHLILRTSWVYGPRASNFYQIIRRKAEANEPMRMVDDQTSVPTTSVFLAQHTVT